MSFRYSIKGTSGKIANCGLIKIEIKQSKADEIMRNFICININVFILRLI